MRLRIENVNGSQRMQKQTWRCKLQKTFPPWDSKDDAFNTRSPSSSKLRRISDNGVLWTLLSEDIWTTICLSSRWLAQTAIEVLRAMLFAGSSSSWVSSPCLVVLDKSSSFFCISPITSCCSSGMYFTTRETVTGMLNFFCN